MRGWRDTRDVRQMLVDNIDPWKALGDDAVVAWDRDVAPLLNADATEFEIYESQDGLSVRIRGMTMGPRSWYTAQACWYPDEGVWRSTMLGWRPWWIR